MNTKLVKSSETRTEGSSKRAGDELESDNSKKQKIDEHMLAIDAIPLATKPLVIVKYKIVKEGKEDLETLWKLVKAKHGNTRPEDDYERVLYNVGCGYESVFCKGLKNDLSLMLVEKRYPLTPITISNMLNKKLQADHWNEIYNCWVITTAGRIMLSEIRSKIDWRTRIRGEGEDKDLVMVGELDGDLLGEREGEEEDDMVSVNRGEEECDV
ncbi:hypothetical protein Tco_0079252 [Tanacetum coccineum]